MTDTVFKAPKTRKGVKCEPMVQNLPPLPKRKRTAEDFYVFCCLILEYENYCGKPPNSTLSQNACKNGEDSAMPLDSGGSSIESFSNESSSSSTSSQDEQKQNDIESDDDSWDLVTCFCAKPFAGRPMIECSNCLTWIHLSCAKIRRTNIPEDFICQNCRDSKASTSRRSQRSKFNDSPPST